MFILFMALSIIAFIIYAGTMIRNKMKQIDDVLQSESDDWEDYK